MDERYDLTSLSILADKRTPEVASCAICRIRPAGEAFARVPRRETLAEVRSRSTVKSARPHADAEQVPAPTGPAGEPEQVLASADHAAAAALRELPEALILVFDRELRFVLTAGHALERLGEPAGLPRGRARGGHVPRGAVGALIEPLFRSALEGETRSREMWTRRAAPLPDGRCRPAA